VIDLLPTINASLNALATVLLCVGFVLIRRKQYRAHGIVMSSAFAVSAIFLVCYLIHKFYKPDIRLRERFPDLPAAWAYFYWFVVLLPHLVLAVAMLPFIGLAFWHASKRAWDKHRRITRWLVWVWLYVSVTGVVIYLLLYQLFPAIG
jgi:putative membrane protein